MLEDKYNSSLLAIFKITVDLARRSPCVRRKFGCVIFNKDGEEFKIYSIGFNARDNPSCDEGCIREKNNLAPGENPEIGGEIHAERFALTALQNWNIEVGGDILIAGYSKAGELLTEFQSWPCYLCAQQLKSWGIRKVFVPKDEGSLLELDIDDIVSYYNRERNDDN